MDVKALYLIGTLLVLSQSVVANSSGPTGGDGKAERLSRREIEKKVKDLHDSLNRAKAAQEEIKKDIQHLKARKDVEKYLRTNEASLDPIEGFWRLELTTSKSTKTLNCFIVRRKDNQFLRGTILPDSAVKFYLGSNVEIEKNREQYRFLISQLAIEFGWITEYPPFTISADSFEFVANRHWQGRVERRQYKYVKLSTDGKQSDSDESVAAKRPQQDDRAPK